MVAEQWNTGAGTHRGDLNDIIELTQKSGPVSCSELNEASLST